MQSKRKDNDLNRIERGKRYTAYSTICTFVLKNNSIFCCITHIFLMLKYHKTNIMNES